MPKKSARPVPQRYRAQKSGWKVKQARDKHRKKTKLALSVLMLVLLIVILGQVVNFAKTFFGPWNMQGAGKSYRWDSRFNINLLVKAKTIAVLSYNPADKRLTVLNFPDNTLVDVTGGAGKWQIRSVYSLGETNGGNGLTLLEQTVSKFLEVPIDGFLEFKGNLADAGPLDLVQKFHRGLTSGISDIKNIRTNLTLLELVLLKINISQVRFDKFKNIDLGDALILEKDKLSDGTEVFVANPAKLDPVLTEISDPGLRREQVSVAVFNATNYPQLAQKAARLITNVGGNVIITTNAGKSYPKTQIVGNQSATLTRLSQIFDSGCGKEPGCVKICSKSEPQLNASQGGAGSCVSDPDVENSRAEINIILGEDFYARQ